VLASTEKIGAASPFTVLPLADVAGIVTDAPPTHEVVARLAELGVPVVQAAAGPG
jgi:DeoR/GlpR family transcriptional regulator of sugar metabolism